MAPGALAEKLGEAHLSHFGRPPQGVHHAPGRVNLIGEHTDYNQGYVLPMPIGLHVAVSISKRSDQEIHLHSLDLQDSSSQTLPSLKRDPQHPWANYVYGVLHALTRRGHTLGGLDLCIAGDIPIGVGLSSSAALEVAVARALNSLFHLGLSPLEVAYVGKECENRFVGVQSGIMDQFSASLGQPGKALLIDCRDNTYSLHRLPPNATIAIVDSKTDRTLASSEYNTRYRECLEAVRLVREHRPQVESLRDLTPDMLEALREALPPVLFRRAHHVVSENQRVLDFVEAMAVGDLPRMGLLMNLSHASLRDYYQVSSPALDTLVEAAVCEGGALGARLTGAGFGGCIVALLERGREKGFAERVLGAYRAATGLECGFYYA